MEGCVPNCPLLLEYDSAHTDPDSGGAIHCVSTQSPKQDRYSVHLLQLGFISVHVFDMLQSDVFDNKIYNLKDFSLWQIIQTVMNNYIYHKREKIIGERRECVSMCAMSVTPVLKGDRKCL